MKAFVFAPTNEFIGKFTLDREEQLHSELEKFLATAPPLPAYSYVQAFKKEWTILSRLPLKLAEGRLSHQEPKPDPLPIVTSQTLPGKTITGTQGIVAGEAIMGANLFRDIAATITDIVGGRSSGYESKLKEGRAIALEEMMAEARQRGADAVIAVTIGYETIGGSGSMLMICASGTAVTVADELGHHDSNGRATG